MITHHGDIDGRTWLGVRRATLRREFGAALLPRSA
jgi:hypothetical protein